MAEIRKKIKRIQKKRELPLEENEKAVVSLAPENEEVINIKEEPSTVKHKKMKKQK